MSLDQDVLEGAKAMSNVPDETMEKKETQQNVDS